MTARLSSKYLGQLYNDVISNRVCYILYMYPKLLDFKKLLLVVLHIDYGRQTHQSPYLNIC